MSATLNPSRPDKDFLEVPANFPFPSTRGVVPPLILCSHWDPTKMLNYILPDQKVAMPLSFRPMTKICTQYVTSAQPEPLPATGNTVFPSGGGMYPPNRYSQAIDQESLLRRQDRPLGISESKQYVPSMQGELYQSRIPLYNQTTRTPAMIDELSMPKVALHIPNSNRCRAAQDRVNMDRAPLLFNNATKNQKYARK